MSKLPVKSLSESIKIRVEGLASTFGQSCEAYYAALNTGLSTVAPNNELRVNAPSKLYADGVLVSEIPELRQLDRTSRISLLISSLLLNPPAPAPLFVQLPELETSPISWIKSCLPYVDNFTQIVPISPNCSAMSVLDSISNWLAETNTQWAYFLVADSQVNFNCLLQQSQISKLAEPNDTRGYIASEGAMFLKVCNHNYNPPPEETMVTISSGVEIDSIGSHIDSVNALTEIVLALNSDLNPSTNGSTDPDSIYDTAMTFDVVFMDNPADNMEEQWAGVRLKLPSGLKHKAAQLPTYPSRQSGIAGLVHFWMGFAYLQGLSSYPLKKLARFLLIEATQEDKRAGFQILL
jgi:hypothetical protein